MAGKGKSKNRHAASAAFFARNNPGMDVEKVANERHSGGNRGGQNRSGGYNNSYNNQGGNRSGGNSKYPSEPASAAYNFVRLPEHVIPAEFYNGHFEGVTKDVLKAYCDHVQQSDTHTGYIDLTITTETPLFIGGPSKQDRIHHLNFMVDKIILQFQGQALKVW